MGFSSLWYLLGDRSDCQGFGLTRDEFSSVQKYLTKTVKGSHDARRTWLAVDYNNFHFNAACLSQGMHAELSRMHALDHLIALYSSMFRIVIFYDERVDGIRSVTKFSRMLEELKYALKPRAPTKRSGFYPNVFLWRPKSAGKEAKSIIDRLDDLKIRFHLKVFDHGPTGEADGEIRKFCRDKLAAGESVIICSGDMSVALGVPFSVTTADGRIATCSVVDPSRMQLQKLLMKSTSAKYDHGQLYLRGPIVPLQLLADALHRALTSQVLPTICDCGSVSSAGAESFPLIDPVGLVWTAALLGADSEGPDVPRESNPGHFVSFVQKCFVPKHCALYKTPTKLFDLLIAATIVCLARAGHRHEGRRSADDLSFCMEQLFATIVHFCQRVKLTASSSPPPLSSSPASQKIPSLCIGAYHLLAVNHGTDSYQSIVEKISLVDVKTTMQCLQRRVGASYDAADQHVLHTTCTRPTATEGPSPSPPTSSSTTTLRRHVYYRGHWGHWTRALEPELEDTEALLHPLMSYAAQIREVHDKKGSGKINPTSHYISPTAAVDHHTKSAGETQRQLQLLGRNDATTFDKWFSDFVNHLSSAAGSAAPAAHQPQQQQAQKQEGAGAAGRPGKSSSFVAQGHGDHHYRRRFGGARGDATAVQGDYCNDCNHGEEEGEVGGGGDEVSDISASDASTLEPDSGVGTGAGDIRSTKPTASGGPARELMSYLTRASHAAPPGYEAFTLKTLSTYVRTHSSLPQRGHVVMSDSGSGTIENKPGVSFRVYGDGVEENLKLLCSPSPICSGALPDSVRTVSLKAGSDIVNPLFASSSPLFDFQSRAQKFSIIAGDLSLSSRADTVVDAASAYVLGLLGLHESTAVASMVETIAAFWSRNDVMAAFFDGQQGIPIEIYAASMPAAVSASSSSSSSSFSSSSTSSPAASRKSSSAKADRENAVKSSAVSLVACLHSLVLLYSHTGPGIDAHTLGALISGCLMAPLFASRICGHYLSYRARIDTTNKVDSFSTIVAKFHKQIEDAIIECKIIMDGDDAKNNSAGEGADPPAISRDVAARVAAKTILHSTVPTPAVQAPYTGAPVALDPSRKTSKHSKRRHGHHGHGHHRRRHGKEHSDHHISDAHSPGDTRSAVGAVAAAAGGIVDSAAATTEAAFALKAGASNLEGAPIVGTRENVRLVELLSKVLFNFIFEVLPSQYHRYYARWFDGAGIIAVLRIMTITPSNTTPISAMLSTAAMCKVLKIASSEEAADLITSCEDSTKIISSYFEDNNYLS